MSNPFENMTKGQKFTCLGVEYEFVRYAGETTSPNRNQWGRATGGSHAAHKVAARVNRRHRGWSPVHYTAFGHHYDSFVHLVD